MANSDSGSKKGPSNPVPSGSAPKKPSAILDLKPSGVEIKSDGEKADAGKVDASKVAPESEERKSDTPSGTATAKSGESGATGGAQLGAAVASGPGIAGKPSVSSTPVTSTPVTPASNAAQEAGKPGNTAQPSATSFSGMSAKHGSETQKSGSDTQKPGSEAQKPAASAGPPKAEPLRQGSARGASVASFMTHLAAGIAGGMLALVGADSIKTQMGGTSGTTAQPEVVSRLAALEQRTVGLTASGSVDALDRRLATAENRLEGFSDIERRIAELRANQEELAKQAANLDATAGKAGVDAAVVDRIAGLEEQLRAIAEAGANDKSAGRIPQLAALSGRIADLQSSLDTRLGDLRKAIGTEIDQRTGKLAETGEAARAGTVRLDRELTGLRADADKLGASVAKLDASQARTLKSVAETKSEADALSSEIAALRERVQKELATVARPGDVKEAVSPISTALAALEQRLLGVVSREKDRQATAERIVLALELANLKRVVDTGAGYATELGSVRRLAGTSLDLSSLEKYKDGGVPTVRQLASDFRALSHSVIAADSATDDNSVLGRLLTGAKSVVRVRRVGEDVEGDGAEAVVARMEAALEQGRLDHVVESSAKLSERALIPSAREWLEKVKARAAALTAISGIEQQLKSAIGTAELGADGKGSGK